MKTFLNDLESHNLTLTEAVDMAQNLEVAGCKWRSPLMVVQARNDDSGGGGGGGVWHLIVESWVELVEFNVPLDT